MVTVIALMHTSIISQMCTLCVNKGVCEVFVALYPISPFLNHNSLLSFFQCIKSYSPSLPPYLLFILSPGQACPTQTEMQPLEQDTK